MLKSGLKLGNPLREDNLDIQDIKGDSYAFRKPLSTILRLEALSYLLVARDALCQQAALIWWAHIGFDRALGYGLKAWHGFRVTHLGVLKGMAAKP
jgi:hypothetical protein